MLQNSYQSYYDNCHNSDSNCDTGMVCFQRDNQNSIPGCNSGGSGDVYGYDYCYYVVRDQKRSCLTLKSVGKSTLTNMMSK